MTVVTVEDAEPKLRELLKRAEEGEAVVITTESGVRLRVSREDAGLRRGEGDMIESAPKTGRRRQFGMWEGRFEVGPEFFEPLPEEELALWLGESPRGRQLEEIGKEWAGRNEAARKP